MLKVFLLIVVGSRRRRRDLAKTFHRWSNYARRRVRTFWVFPPNDWCTSLAEPVEGDTHVFRSRDEAMRWTKALYDVCRRGRARRIWSSLR